MSTEPSEMGVVVESTFDFPGEDRERPDTVTKRVRILKSIEASSGAR